MSKFGVSLVSPASIRNIYTSSNNSDSDNNNPVINLDQFNSLNLNIYEMKSDYVLNQIISCVILDAPLK